jgi:hypothetical protein
MPLYDVKCLRTKTTFERTIPLANFEEPIFCACGSPAQRVISKPMFSVDNTGYHCPNSGKWIGSKRQHEENLKKQDCRVLEPGEKEANEKRRADDNKHFEDKVEATVEREISHMPSASREQLYNEMIATDLEVARR